MKVGELSNDPTLLVSLKTPLTSKSALILAMVVAEHPDHVVSVENQRLTLRRK